MITIIRATFNQFLCLEIGIPHLLNDVQLAQFLGTFDELFNFLSNQLEIVQL